MTGRLENKVAIITGASRGIGKATALNFQNIGYQVIGTSTNKKGIEMLSKKNIIAYELDLNSKDSISVSPCMSWSI